MATRRAPPAPLAAFVLHHHDWSESSLILELFTRDQGRIAVIAKGAKRPYSQLRPVLLAFQRLNVVLGGKPGKSTGPASGSNTGSTTDIHLLRSAEWAGGSAMLSGAALLAGFHANELLLRGLARHDAHPHLFDAYADTLPALAEAEHDPTDAPARTAAALRAFELCLLAETGVLPDLACVTLTQQGVQASSRYRLEAEAGVVTAAPTDASLSGATLAALQAALSAKDMAALRTACRAAPQELRVQLRHLLHYHLGTARLRTRALMAEVQKLIA